MLQVETAVEDVAVLITEDGVDRPEETGSAVTRPDELFTPSMVLIVAARRGVGKGLNVETSQVDFDFFGGGRGEFELGADADFEDDETLDLIDALSSSLVFSSDFPLPMMPHQPEGFVWTSKLSVFFGSISPNTKQKAVSPTPKQTLNSGKLTTHIPHCNLERLPIPSILPTMHIPHDVLHFIQPRFRVLTKIVVCDFVPVVFGHFTLNTTSLHDGKPFIYGHVLLRFALEDGCVFP